MKKLISNILNGVVILTAVNGLWSCTSESPFETEGEGIVQLRTVVNSITTRSEDDQTATDPQQALKDNCVVYISRTYGDNPGLIYKQKGLDKVPSQMTLKAGTYVAEAWTGDSVGASFESKFYRGYQPFEVTKGSNQNVCVNCQIQNVVVSIKTSTIDPNLMKDDYTITISTARGELEFTKDNASVAKGYFMLPIKKEASSEKSSETESSETESEVVDDMTPDDTSLVYSISGTRQDGKPFTKTGRIKDVQRAHEYILNFDYNPDNMGTSSEGAAFIKIHIKDEEVQGTGAATVHARPTITGVEFDITKQQVYTSDDLLPESLILQMCGFGGLKSLYVESESAAAIGLPASDLNLFELNDAQLEAYKNAGFELTLPKYKETTKVATAYLKIHKSMLAKLNKDQETEHVINFTITDMDETPQTTEVSLRIARNNRAIVLDDPIVVDKLNPDINLTPHGATIAYSLADTYEGTPGVEYCKAGDSNWVFVAAPVSPQNIRTRAAEYTMTITGLEEATEYKYRAACGDFHSKKEYSFTTESSYTIPDASFEDWSTYKASTLLGTKTVVLPGSTGDKETSFWGSGNEGAATANMTLTDKSTDMKHSGQYSAKLASNAAMGVIAAGNIFTGKYVKTDGTNGVLSVGREYNGSHPSKLRVHANYRPGSNVSAKSENEKYLPANFNGGKDHGQIYVALTTEAVEIRTNPNDRKLFDPNDQVVLAYGQVTWTDNFGTDGNLQEIEIPLEYNDRAKTKKPTHLVIVCSASKYGDYFSGSKTSVMYVDDFELVYE